MSLAIRSEAGRSRRLAPSPGYLFVLPAVAFFLVFVAYPLLSSVYLSLTQWPGFGSPTFIGLANFQALAQDSIFRTAVRVTVEYTVVTTILQTVVPMAVAILLAAGWRGGVVFRTLIFLPAVVSLTVSGIVWELALAPQYGVINETLSSIGLSGLARPWLGTVDTALPTIIAVSLWQSTGFFMLIFYAGLQGIDRDMYESARIDGANKWQEIRYVTVPLLRPVTEVVVILNVINGLKIFDLMYVMTGGGPVHATETFATYLFGLSFGTAAGAVPEFGYSDAIGVVIFVVALVATVVLNRLRQSEAGGG